jgi:hypothetical protein
MVKYQIHVLLQIPYKRIQEVLSEFLQLTPHYKKNFSTLNGTSRHYL